AAQRVPRGGGDRGRADAPGVHDADHDGALDPDRVDHGRAGRADLVALRRRVRRGAERGAEPAGRDRLPVQRDRRSARRAVAGARSSAAFERRTGAIDVWELDLARPISEADRALLSAEETAKADRIIIEPKRRQSYRARAEL